MQTHVFDDSGHTKCGTFDPADEFALPEETPSCIECSFHDRVQVAWEKYVAQPSNFGGESHVIRMAEHDAFFAGAFAILKETVPF
jgi:hypothetical protein